MPAKAVRPEQTRHFTRVPRGFGTKIEAHAPLAIIGVMAMNRECGSLVSGEANGHQMHVTGVEVGQAVRFARGIDVRARETESGQHGPPQDDRKILRGGRDVIIRRQQRAATAGESGKILQECVIDRAVDAEGVDGYTGHGAVPRELEDLVFVADLTVGDEDKAFRSAGLPGGADIENVAQRREQLGTAAGSDLGEADENLVLQQFIAAHQAVGEVLKIAVEAGDPDTVVGAEFADEGVEGFSSLSPFPAAHAAGTVEQEVDVLGEVVDRRLSRFHLWGAQLQQGVEIAVVPGGPGTRNSLGDRSFLPAQDEIAIREMLFSGQLDFERGACSADDGRI